MMKHGKRNIDSNNITAVIKNTTRGKLSVACAAVGIIVFFGNVSHGIGKAVGPLALWLLFAGFLLSSAANSIEKSQMKEVQKKQEEKADRIKRSATKRIDDYIYIDEPNQLWCVPENGTRQYTFSDLLDYEVIDNGEVVVGGSVLGTAVGAMAGGLTGALLGASASKATDWCNELKIKLSVNDISTPTIEIPLIKKAALKDSNAYKNAVQTADEIAGVLKVIKARNGR